MTIDQKQISALLAELNELETIATVEEKLASGEDPILLMDECQEGIVEVGRRYETGEYYISALIMAGEIMREVSDILLPVLKKHIIGRASGKVLLATVQNDIHFIGKNIFKVLLQCSGYTVQDVGEDVPPEKILAEALEFSPDIIGLSCLLSTCYDSMHDTIDILKNGTKDLDPAPRIIIGGRVNDKVSRHVGAHGWADDAMLGLRLCHKLVRR